MANLKTYSIHINGIESWCINGSKTYRHCSTPTNTIDSQIDWQFDSYEYTSLTVCVYLRSQSWCCYNQVLLHTLPKDVKRHICKNKSQQVLKRNIWPSCSHSLNSSFSFLSTNTLTQTKQPNSNQLHLCCTWPSKRRKRNRKPKPDSSHKLKFNQTCPQLPRFPCLEQTLPQGSAGSETGPWITPTEQHHSITLTQTHPFCKGRPWQIQIQIQIHTRV